MKTRQDLILATLELLQADGGAGQSPAPEDVTVIDGIIDGKLAELGARKIHGSDDPNEFQDEFVSPLATILANEAAPKFGQPRNEASKAAAEGILRELKNSTYVDGSVLAVDYL